MSSERATQYLDRNTGLVARRNPWFPLWQDLADVLFPNRGGFTTPIMPGKETAREIYDTTPQQARRSLATAIDGLMKPQTSRWFWMRAQDEAINDDEEAKLWFETVQERMWTAIYDPPARFIQNSGIVDNDLSAFGLGYLWIGENRARNGLAFRALHIADCAIDENSDGVVDTIHIERNFTARQAIQRFGDKAPPKVHEAMRATDQKERLKPFRFVQCVAPRDEYDERRRDNLNMPFESVIVNVDGGDPQICEESGYPEFPAAVPRWEGIPNEIYPRSPGMIALPDSRTLQAMGHTILVGGQRAIDPPTWVVDDAVMSAVRTFPGGLTILDAQAVKDSGGKPMGTLDAGAMNLPIGREMQDDYRKMVSAAFFKDVFALPIDAKMTATEVMQRKEEFLRNMGPTLGQLENDYIGAIVRRVFGIMLRSGGDPANGGAFGPPPEVLLERDLNFEFMSPIQQAKRQVEMAGLSRTFEMLGPLMQLRPDAADNFDVDEIARDIPDITQIPAKWISSKEKVQGIRDQRAQQQQQAAQLEAAQGMAGAAKQGADAMHSAAKGQQVAAQTAQNA